MTDNDSTRENPFGDEAPAEPETPAEPEAAAASSDTTSDLAEAAREYAQARVDRLAIEAQAKPYKKIEEGAAARFLKLAADTGISSVRIEVNETMEAGGRKKVVPTRYTLAPKRTRFPVLKVAKDAVIAALKRSGRYAYLVTEDFSTSTLGALLREFEDEGKALPPTLAEVMEVGERFDVSMTKSSK